MEREFNLKFHVRLIKQTTPFNSTSHYRPTQTRRRHTLCHQSHVRKMFIFTLLDDVECFRVRWIIMEALV